MLYLIGGPPRAGKSQLSQLFIKQRPMYSLSCDFTYDLNITTDTPNFAHLDILEKGEAYYPVLKQLVSNINRQAENCLIEGEVILPRHAAELSASYTIRVCFLVLSQPTIEDIIKHGGHFNWPLFKLSNGMQDEVDDLVELTKERSKIVKEECLKYKQTYFDLSLGNFEEQQQIALNYLLAQS